MSGFMILSTIAELGVLVFFIWGIFNESVLVSFEEKVACFIRRRFLKVRRGNKHNSGRYCA